MLAVVNSTAVASLHIPGLLCYAQTWLLTVRGTAEVKRPHRTGAALSLKALGFCEELREVI